MICNVVRGHSNTVVRNANMGSTIRKKACENLHFDNRGTGVVTVFDEFQNRGRMIFDAFATPRQHGASIDREKFGHRTRVYLILRLYIARSCCLQQLLTRNTRDCSFLRIPGSVGLKIIAPFVRLIDCRSEDTKVARFASFRTVHP